MPTSPPAARITRPRWRDGRLVAGVLLVLLSVLLGARVVSAADTSTSYLSVNRPLPAGHVLSAGDLSVVRARLAGAAGSRYFRDTQRARLVGDTLTAPLVTGELLPASAVLTGSARPAARVVPVLVKAGRVPPVAEGDRVDVYVLSQSSGSGGSARTDQEQLVLHDVEVVAVDAVGGDGDVSLRLRVEPAAAIRAVAASQSGRVDVTLVESAGDGGPGATGPASQPGYGS